MTTPPNPRDAKALLRRQVLAARARLTATERGRVASRLATHARAAWSTERVVAAYLAVANEPPTAAMIDALADNGTTVLLPVVVGERLDWAAYESRESLRRGRFGLWEPTGPTLGARGLSSVGVVIAPALAVDGQGHRLGRGGGYYDRALLEVTAPVVAVVYDDELVDEVPVEPHDRRVDAVLRPAGLLSLPDAGEA